MVIIIIEAVVCRNAPKGIVLISTVVLLRAVGDDTISRNAPKGIVLISTWGPDEGWQRKCVVVMPRRALF